MNDKKFYFLTGLHRSGNTLLSSILNQNPKIYSSPLSPVSEHLWQLHVTTQEMQSSIRLEDSMGSKNIIKNLLINYYSDIDKEYIFDREKSWSVLGNVNLIKKYINLDPKFIMTVRPILDIAASVINIMGPLIQVRMVNDGWVNRPYLSKNDNMAEYIISRPHYDTSIKLIAPLMDEHKKNFYFVEYDDIVNSPKKTLNGIYDFLNIERFEHDFNNIKKIEKDNDIAVGDPENMHYINKTITKSKTKPEDLFSEDLMNKYKNANYWRNV